MNQEDTLVDEAIDEQGEQYAAEEISICRTKIDPTERLLGILSGNVDGKDELDRMVLTDQQVIFYSRGNPNSIVRYDYQQVDSAKAKKGKLLTHLGEISIISQGKKLTFKNVNVEYLNQILDIISRMKANAPSKQTDRKQLPTFQPRFCTKCGRQTKIEDRFCRNCGAELK